MRELARSAKLELVEINFERDKSLRAVFADDLTPSTILSNLEIVLNRPINPTNTLLFLDELQDCPRALTALKHFTDAQFSLPLIGAGSYLGLLEGTVEDVSQPIGYVDELTLFPMSFEEFLRAADAPPSLLEHYLQPQGLNTVAHEALLQLYRNYLFVGGMPEVVGTWFEIKKHSGTLLAQTVAVRELQKSLLSKYKADFAKYHPRDALHIARTWEIIAEQLSRNFTAVARFQFKGGLPGKRDYKAFADYFTRLEACGLVHRSYVIEDGIYPLKSRKKEALFKCYYGDTGLLLAEMDMSLQSLEASAEVYYKGPLAENFVAINLIRLGYPLFSFVRSRGDAELEFLIQHQAKVVPIEVKNNQTTAKSLRWFSKQFKPQLVLKFSNKMGVVEPGVWHYPIYLCEKVLQKLRADGC